MDKIELIKIVAEDTKFTQKDVGDTLTSLISAITNALKKGDDVRLIGFGAFRAHKTKARKGRNPRTGAELKIAAKTIARFTPGVQLATAVNK